MRFLLSVIVILVLVCVGALVFAWSGIYNISATEPHWKITSEYLEILRDRSISAHSSEGGMVEGKEAAAGEAAYSHYHAMCRLCHGAPGYDPVEFAEGLYPQPPLMASGHIQSDMSRAEVFWIVKNGIKFTGMPAFGPTHSDAEIAEIVNLAFELPQKPNEDYRRQAQEAAEHGEEEHGHGEESGAHAEDGGHS